MSDPKSSPPLVTPQMRDAVLIDTWAKFVAEARPRILADFREAAEGRIAEAFP